MSGKPKIVFCFSGKRKTGKDFITEILHERLPTSIIIRLSAPIKQHWAESKQLNYHDLLSDGKYKEDHRLEMIIWGEEQRKKDPGIFCRLAIGMFKAEEYSVWIISDARRSTDLQYFKQQYGDKVKTVRIVASERIRTERGFVFSSGIDDAESECGLDHITDWDVIIKNEGDNYALEKDIQLLLDLCKNK